MFSISFDTNLNYYKFLVKDNVEIPGYRGVASHWPIIISATHIFHSKTIEKLFVINYE